ncbi:MAG: signal peptidase II [Gammaproteobacteria bacterium]|nr:signal peptidase II [Gammaproteobacteria bacterium]
MIGATAMSTEKKLPGLKWFWFLPLYFALDVGSKWLVLQKLSLGESTQVFSWLNFTLAYNRGIAFSLLSNHELIGKIFLISFIVVICIGVAVWLAKTPTNDKWSGFSLSLILGGALGNLFDRLYYGYVIDFIDFHIQHWHWYTFNLADCFITIGAIMSIKTVLLSSE